MNELVSIVIPIYGVEKYIENCLSSVCKQTYKNIEIIVVNDGTKDNSAILAKKFLSKIDNIRYQVLDKENGGLSSARNYGIKHCTGVYVCFVDSDDSVCPDYVETLLNGFQNDSIDMSVGSFHVVKEKTYTPVVFKEPLSYELFSKEETQSRFLYRTFKLAPWCVLYRTSFLLENDLFFDETVKFSEDQAFFWHVFEKVRFLSYANHVIYDYFTRKGSISTAPALEKILTGYNAITECKKLNLTETCKTYMIGRWVFGTLHNTSKYCDYKFFKKLYLSLNAKQHLKELNSFPDIKTVFCTKLLLRFRFLAYLFFRTVG